MKISDLRLHTHRDLERLREIVRVLPAGSHRSVNELTDEHSTRGERMADRITAVVGSWRFIIIQSCVLALWLIVNSIGWLLRWDPYPFILLNLVLSFQAAFTAPIIMMSQNRQAARDRLASELDYEINRVAALEVDQIQERLDELANQQWAGLMENLAEHTALLERIHDMAMDLHARRSSEMPEPPV